MDTRVIGANMEVGEALTKYVEDHLNRHVKKYFDTAIFADVHFNKHTGKHGDKFYVNIVVNEGVKGGGIIIKSDAEAGDAYGCFNEAIHKVAEQLGRHKEKIKNHRREKGGIKNVIYNQKDE